MLPKYKMQRAIRFNSSSQIMKRVVNLKSIQGFNHSRFLNLNPQGAVRDAISLCGLHRTCSVELDLQCPTPSEFFLKQK